MTERDRYAVREAAVLVPVFRDGGGDLRLVLVRRTEGGIHSGQIAFPGGKRAPADRSLLETALRETEEEIGIDRTQVKILDELPVVDTLTTGFRIHPFLGALRPPRQWRPQPMEIAEVLEIGIGELLAPGNHGEEEWSLPEWATPQAVRFYRVGEHKLWGATYRILRPLVSRLASGDWEF
jgi:8-oxo-dGTP pyrophosphatase MutT (NUDIX family)